MFSPEVISLFADLLAQVRVPANAADFDQQAALVSQARRELSVVLNEQAQQGLGQTGNAPHKAKEQETKPQTTKPQANSK